MHAASRHRTLSLKPLLKEWAVVVVHLKGRPSSLYRKQPYLTSVKLMELAGPSSFPFYNFPPCAGRGAFSCYAICILKSPGVSMFFIPLTFLWFHFLLFSFSQPFFRSFLIQEQMMARISHRKCSMASSIESKETNFPPEPITWRSLNKSNRVSLAEFLYVFR